MAILRGSRRKTAWSGLVSRVTSAKQAVATLAGSAALPLVLPVFGGSTGGRKPGRFSQEVPGDQPVELPPSIGLESGGFRKPHLLEATDG